jgi:predicted methyltransferase
LTGHLSTAAPSAVRKLADLSAAVDAAADPAARSMAQRALYRHALTVANWWGLKPAASVLFALPVGVVAGIAVTLMTGRFSEPGKR